MKKSALMVCAMFAQVVAFAAPTVSDMKVTPIPPWGLAIDYAVSAATEVEEKAAPSVKVVHGEQTYAAKTLLGDLSFTNGAHRIYWNAAQDGVTASLTNATVQLVYTPVRTAENSLYCVIDLSAGANATSYPVTYLNEEPEGGFNTTEYKTTKLVLKRVNPGTFIMGEDQTCESNRVTLTKAFFMGIFEVTQRQWLSVMGSNPSSFAGHVKPVDGASYEAIRGSSAGLKWPASNAVDAGSFIGKLRVKTSADFDLPTEAQWEYACRAGTRMYYNYGEVEDGEYMWYKENSNSKTHEVGETKPNAWGFYDMHGNVVEWCLNLPGLVSNGGVGVDPVGPSSTDTPTYRSVRGGSFDSNAVDCSCCERGSARLALEVINNGHCYGFRLALPLK